MIRPSPELLAETRRWYKTVISGEHQELRNFISASQHMRFVGSDDGESWSGPAVRQAIGAHFDEVPTLLRAEEIEAEAFETGDIGWCYMSHQIWIATRKNAPIIFRATFIFALESGNWKMVHRHGSVPTSNSGLLGHTHNAIQNLVDAALQGFALTQREGLASVMFTDIVNSSALATEVGDRDWTSLIKRHFATVRKIVEDHDGEFVKSLGDGTMSNFSSARLALNAAREIQLALQTETTKTRLSVRIGLHTGDVVQSDDDFFGTVVNKAARITATAAAGEIHVSDVTRAIVGEGHDFSFSNPHEVHLRGFDGTHEYHRLDWKASL
jgi:class 3 adenylate cyclase